MKGIRLRKAMESDLQAYFELANDQAVRINSVNTADIPLPVHRKWFEQKLSSPACVLFVLENEGSFAGQIRFDIEKKTAWIDYAIVPRYRGLGLGAHILREGIKMLIATRQDFSQIAGKVKPENKSSIRAFQKAGLTEFTNMPDEGDAAMKFFGQSV